MSQFIDCNNITIVIIIYVIAVFIEISLYHSFNFGGSILWFLLCSNFFAILTLWGRAFKWFLTVTNQKFPLSQTRSGRVIKLLLEQPTDTYGRIIIYNLDLIGSWTINNHFTRNPLTCCAFRPGKPESRSKHTSFMFERTASAFKCCFNCIAFGPRSVSGNIVNSV